MYFITEPPKHIHTHTTGAQSRVQGDANATEALRRITDRLSFAQRAVTDQFAKLETGGASLVSPGPGLTGPDLARHEDEADDSEGWHAESAAARAGERRRAERAPRAPHPPLAAARGRLAGPGGGGGGGTGYSVPSRVWASESVSAD